MGALPGWELGTVDCFQGVELARESRQKALVIASVRVGVVVCGT